MNHHGIDHPRTIARVPPRSALPLLCPNDRAALVVKLHRQTDGNGWIIMNLPGVEYSGSRRSRKPTDLNPRIWKYRVALDPKKKNPTIGRDHVPLMPGDQAKGLHGPRCLRRRETLAIRFRSRPMVAFCRRSWSLRRYISRACTASEREQRVRRSGCTDSSRDMLRRGTWY